MKDLNIKDPIKLVGAIVFLLLLGAALARALNIYVGSELGTIFTVVYPSST